MDFVEKLKPFFPVSGMATDQNGLVKAIIIYVVCAIIAGVILGLLSHIPFVGLIIGIVGAIVEIYVVVGICLAVLTFLNAKKN